MKTITLNLTDEESKQLVTLVQFMVRDIEDDLHNEPDRELSGVSAYFLSNAFRLVGSLSSKISAAVEEATEGGEE